MIEQYERWEPIKNLVSRYFVDSFTYGKRGVEIILEDAVGDSPQVRICFSSFLCEYRYTDEDFCWKLLRDFDKQHTGTSYTVWTFFKVKNSEYIKWLSERSGEWSETYNFRHYAFMVEDGILDIVSQHEPIVEYAAAKENE